MTPADRLAQPRLLTREEELAIKSLERLAKRWPRSLTLASMGGSLVVFPTDAPTLEMQGTGFGIDPEQVVCWIGTAIPNTGGDW